MRRKLTDVSVRTAKPDGDGYTIWDTLSPVGLRVLKRRKTWTVMFGRERKRVTLGHYPEMNLAQAREAARRKRGGARSERVETALEEYVTRKRTELRPTSLYGLERCLDKYFRFKGDLGDITYRQIMDIVSPLTPASGWAAYGHIRAFLGWCVNRGYLETSPLWGKTGPRRGASRDRVLSQEEFVRVVQAASQGLPDDYCRVVLLLTLTGQRRGQFAQVQPEWYSPSEATLTFPASVMKGKRVHVVPVTPFVATLIGKPILVRDFSGCKRRFDTQCAVENWSLHDLRRTWRSRCSELFGGQNREAIERIMDHVQPGVQGIYDRYSYAREMRQVLTTHELNLLQLCGLLAQRTPGLSKVLV